VYGAGLTEYLQRHAEGPLLVEVDRPDRATRRRSGKSDPIDAIAAARSAAAGIRTGVPKQRGGPDDALRALRVARRDAVEHRGQAMRRLKALIVTAPAPLRAQLEQLRPRDLIGHCAALRPGIGDPLDLAAAEPIVATKLALRMLARRCQSLTDDITELDAIITPLVAAMAPELLARTGVGPDVAGQLLVTAGDNPDRIRTDAAFAALTGVSPLPASSGRSTGRHRLNRGGDRQANCALYRVTLSRMRWDPRTRAYVTRRTSEGKTKRDIIRCLKRYIARELYTVLRTPDPGTHTHPSSRTAAPTAPAAAGVKTGRRPPAGPRP
jgi:transposase